MDQITLEIDGREIVVRFRGKEARYLTVKAALEQAQKWLEWYQAFLDEKISDFR